MRRSFARFRAFDAVATGTAAQGRGARWTRGAEESGSKQIRVRAGAVVGPRGQSFGPAVGVGR